jgi:two-component system phosphate regulon response regulator PhoB
VKKLLIADDQEGIRALVRMTLESDAYEIIEAADGNRALALAQEQHPDLILLDVMMPGQSGFDVCRALKGDPATAEITIVLLTARAQDSDFVEGQSAGADKYLTKPFSPVALLELVDQYMES